MAAKRKPLDLGALDAAAGRPKNPVDELAAVRQAQPVTPPLAEGKAKVATRAGRVPIQGYYPEETRRRIKMLSAKTGRTVEDLLGEAIDDLFSKHAI